MHDYQFPFRRRKLGNRFVKVGVDVGPGPAFRRRDPIHPIEFPALDGCRFTQHLPGFGDGRGMQPARQINAGNFRRFSGKGCEHRLRNIKRGRRISGKSRGDTAYHAGMALDENLKCIGIARFDKFAQQLGIGFHGTIHFHPRRSAQDIFSRPFFRRKCFAVALT